MELELIGRITEGDAGQWPTLLTSLRRIGETSWREMFEALSAVNRMLARDPAGAYARMDFESRDRYCKTIADLARRSNKDEMDVTELVLHLSEQVSATSDGSRAAIRRTHVGFYLVDEGKKALEEKLGYRIPWRAHLSRLILRYPTSFYLLGIELLTLAMAFGILYRVGVHASAYVALVLLALPATQAAVDFMNNLTTFLLPPRVLPQLDFSDGIPDDCVTLVAVPTLFANEAQVRDLVLDLEIRFLANCGPNLYFALLSDTARFRSSGGGTRSTRGAGSAPDRGLEFPLPRWRPLAILPAAPPSGLQRIGKSLDGVGAKAWKTDRPESVSARRV